MEKCTVYDREAVYKEEIDPLLRKIMQVCAMNGIPCFVTFAVKNDDKGTKYVSDMYSAITNDIALKDDNICKMANVLNGFDVVEQNKTLELEM